VSRSRKAVDQEKVALDKHKKLMKKFDEIQLSQRIQKLLNSATVSESVKQNFVIASTKIKQLTRTELIREQQERTKHFNKMI